MKTGPEVAKRVQDLCESIVNERAAELAERMESWRVAGKKRRLVDFRFDTDSKLCSGGILSVCDKVFDAKKQANDDGDDDDDRDEL